MFDDFKSSLANNALERAAFYSVAQWLTRTVDMFLRALDYNTTDLMNQPKTRLRTMIDSFVTPENLFLVKRLQINLYVSYNVAQHHYPLLVGASTTPQNNIKFALGDVATMSESKCSLSDLIIRFFKEGLTTSLGGIINMH